MNYETFGDCINRGVMIKKSFAVLRVLGQEKHSAKRLLCMHFHVNIFDIQQKSLIDRKLHPFSVSSRFRQVIKKLIMFEFSSTSLRHATDLFPFPLL